MYPVIFYIYILAPWCSQSGKLFSIVCQKKVISFFIHYCSNIFVWSQRNWKWEKKEMTLKVRDIGMWWNRTEHDEREGVFNLITRPCSIFAASYLKRHIASSLSLSIVPARRILPFSQALASPTMRISWSSATNQGKKAPYWKRFRKKNIPRYERLWCRYIC